MVSLFSISLFKSKPNSINYIIGNRERLFHLTESNVWWSFMGILVAFTYGYA